MYKLRNYQKEASDSGVFFFNNSKSKKNAIEVLPTGSGKSLVIADIANRTSGNTLVFQPTKEILEQNISKMLSYEILNIGVYSASLNSKTIKRITFATIGSVINCKGLFHHFNNIIVDECHFVNSKKGMYKEFFESFSNVKILGFTATPYRLQSYRGYGSILKFLTRTRPKVFHDLIYYVQNSYLFNNGYLCKLQYFPVFGINRDKLSKNTTGAGFTYVSVLRHYKEINFECKLLDIVKRLLKAGRKNILVFTQFVYEAEYVANNCKGIKLVTGKTKKREREKILSELKSGKILGVANAQVLTVGFDFPELETVLIGKSTMSLAQWYQMIGRGVRPHKNKKSCWVIDLGGNYKVFGKVEDLKIDSSEKNNNLWHIESKDKQLTNVFY